jgi:hypothetical protein
MEPVSLGRVSHTRCELEFSLLTLAGRPDKPGQPPGVAGSWLPLKTNPKKTMRDVRLETNSRGVRYGGAVCSRSDVPGLSGVQMITFARVGDDEAGGLPVLMRDQLPTNSITGDGSNNER